jgi:hypothetical protein
MFANIIASYETSLRQRQRSPTSCTNCSASAQACSASFPASAKAAETYPSAEGSHQRPACPGSPCRDRAPRGAGGAWSRTSRHFEGFLGKDVGPARSWSGWTA